jgi:DNA-binding winged helix-turn-helix (wHTH) protein/tetratricopeptide (TPR) repeat protein
MVEQNQRIYSFDGFTIDAVRRVLLRDDQQVPLPSRAFDLLLALVESGGRELSKEELMQRIWADQIVEDANLTVTMANLRKALGEKAGDHRYIVTIPGRGYRFIGKLRPRALIIEEYTRGQIVIENDDVPARRSALPGTGHRPVPASRGWLLAALSAISLVGILLAGYLWWFRSGKATAAPQIKSIAVLPFKPLVAEGRDESLELGMADTLIARLSNIRELNVRPISAVRRYTALDQDPIAAGREQRVDAVLEGQLQRAGGKLRVTVRMLRIADGAPLWSSQYDEQMTDIFAVQDSISERVVGALALKLTSEERALVAERQTSDTEAYQLYLKGRYFWNKRSGEEIKKSVDCFHQAIEKDPNYALAYAGLAQAYVLLANYSDSTPQEAYSKAAAAVTQALKINDNLSEAHAALGYIKAGYEFDFAGAEREYKRAIELNPNDPTARHWYGEFLALTGHATEAIAQMKKAQELEPLSLIINLELGNLLTYARQFDAATEQMRKTLDLDPNFARAHADLGQIYRFRGQYEQAIPEFQKAVSINKEDTYGVGQLGYTYGKLGRTSEARQILDQLLEQAKRSHVMPWNIAVVYIGLGDKDRAFAWLEKAYAERDEDLMYLNVDPVVDPLRSDPRFADLLRRVGLPH